MSTKSNHETDLATQYDHLFKNEWRQFLDYGPSARTRYRILLKLINSLEVDHRTTEILDCGCGTGEMLILLHRENYQNLSGCDFSEESVQLTNDNLKRCQIPAKEVFQADLTRESDFKGKYDLINCSEVLEHVPDHEAAARTLFDILNPGGHLIVSVPYRMKYWSQHDDLSLHVRRYEPGEMESLLQRVGFKIEKSYIWGALTYELYSRILTRIPPSTVMSTKQPGPIKRAVCKALYAGFHVDDTLAFTRSGRRIFVVARKAA